jgi:hypothetical protein
MRAPTLWPGHDAVALLYIPGGDRFTEAAGLPIQPSVCIVRESVERTA